MDENKIDNYFEDINKQEEKNDKEINTMSIFGIENNNINNDENDKNEMIIEKEINNEKDEKIDNNEETQNNNINNEINDKENNDKENNDKENNDKENNDKENNDKENNDKENNDDNDSKKEKKVKKRVRGPNKCYRIIEDFFKNKKRTKNINENNNTLNKDDGNNNDEQQNNEEDKNKKIKKRTKIIDMSEKFDEFLKFVEEKVNKSYYDSFIYPVIYNYKEFYIEKEKEYKNNKNLKASLNDEKSNNNNINNSIDENLAKRKKSYGLENFLEIPEIVNDFVKFLYNKNIYATDESKIEMIEIIFIFCTWLKQNHYSSYSIEYLIESEEEK